MKPKKLKYSSHRSMSWGRSSHWNYDVLFNPSSWEKSWVRCYKSVFKSEVLSSYQPQFKSICWTHSRNNYWR